MTSPIVIAGVGNPWLGDLDFGPQFLRRYLDVDWPEGVHLVDGATAAHRFLHELQAIEPARVILVTAFPRGDDPGTVRRYKVEHTEELDPEDVAGRLGEAAGGVIDFDHTLIVARYYSALPDDTMAIEVEAVDESFGDTFSPDVEASFEPVLKMVWEEISRR